jgi:drug/metabolite transporter (DMT)-like permease
MSWILLATAGQFLNAVVSIFDKYIVSDDALLPRPFVYAFYSCLFTGFWVVIYLVGYIPGFANIGVPSMNNVMLPTIQVVAMSFLAAYTFFIALVSMYDALRHADSASTIPIIGTVSSLATFGLSHLFFDVALTDSFIIGVILLSVGTLLVAQTIPKRHIIIQVFHSGLFFALHYITMKALFEETSFDDGFFWSRVGFVLFTLSLLLVPAYYDKVKGQTEKTSRKAGFIVILAKSLAGIAAFMLLKATHLGEVSVVQALDGMRYVFILLITVIFAHWLPESASDRDNRPGVWLRRMMYVIIISVGYVVLFI